MKPQEEYYHSHSQLPFIGEEGQVLLSKARVLVVGAGGLGCPCLSSLAGAGVGNLGIADGDRIAISNLHRQPLFAFNDNGLAKTEVAAKRLQQCNPFINIQIHEGWVDADSIVSLISGYDIIADCTDNFHTRYLLNDVCVQLDKPLVYGAIHQAEGHLTVFNHQGGPTLRCLFPQGGDNVIRSCSEIGAYSITTAVIGHLMANEIIKMITNSLELHSGRLLQLNLLDGSQQLFTFSRTTKGLHERRNTEQYPTFIKSPDEMNALMANSHSMVLVDLREETERMKGHIGGLHIPLHQFLQQKIFTFNTNDEIVLYCQQGQRSHKALQHLQSLGYTHACQLEGGLESLQKNYPQHIIRNGDVP